MQYYLKITGIQTKYSVSYDNPGRPCWNMSQGQGTYRYTYFYFVSCNMTPRVHAIYPFFIVIIKQLIYNSHTLFFSSDTTTCTCSLYKIVQLDNTYLVLFHRYMACTLIPSKFDIMELNHSIIP